MAKILNEMDARAVAEKIGTQAIAENIAQQISMEQVISMIEQTDLYQEGAGMEELGALLMMPEEQFAVLAPVFLEELEKQYSIVNNQVYVAQILNVKGVRAEDITNNYNLICETIDKETVNLLSAQKRAFLKRMLSIVFNGAINTEFLGNRSMLIPIEYCRENAKMPAYAHVTDAGMDVFATEEITINPGETKLVPLGIKCALPMGYELQVRPKSGRSLKSKLRVANAPGTVDAGYRDEIGVIVDNIEPFIKSAEMDENGRLYNVEFGSSITIGAGEKFAQLVLSEVPKAVFYEVETVSGIGEDRQGGFGSTGDK